MHIKTISVIGLGYIGLPTASVFASKRIHVVGVDVKREAVSLINQGLIHIVEPGLDELVKDVVSSGFLRATEIVEPADVFIIAVPTPFKERVGNAIPEPDLSYVMSAVEGISKVLKKGDLVVLESTSPVGTTEKICSFLSSKRSDLLFPNDGGGAADVNVAYCPERVLPGRVLEELVSNDRIIGGISNECSSKAVSLYKIVVEGECVVTNTRTAEMTKLTENSCRDVQIAFANELSIICDRMSINVWELISLANRHPRVNILNPGPGVGGHCIAVDPWFIVAGAPDDSKMISCARSVNDGKPYYILEKVEACIDGFLEQHPHRNRTDVRIASFGLSFKANIDDLRGSPAVLITKELVKRYPGQVWAVEPNLNELPKFLAGSMELVEYSYAMKAADVKVLLVGHHEFEEDSRPESAFVDCVGYWASK